MNKAIIYFVLIFTIILGLPSCHKDDLSSYKRELSTVKVFISDKNLVATLGETLTAEVDSIIQTLPDGKTVKIASDNPDFEFEWWTGYSINGGAFIDSINAGYALNMFVDDIYSPDIVFLVREKETGLEYYANYRLSVNSPYGTGFLVVDTKDGVSSQFHEIQNQYLYDQCEDVNKVLRNSYKVNQGADFQGLVSHVSYHKLRGTAPSVSRMLIYKEDGHCVALDGYYNTVKENDGMYMVSQNSYKITDQQKGFSYTTNINEDGQVEECEYGYGKDVFTFPKVTGDLSPYRASVMRSKVYYGMNLFIFDEIANRFLRMPFNKGTFIPITSATPLFDYNNVGALDALYMASGYYFRDGFGKEYGVVTILKSETSEDYFAYIFKGNLQRIVNLNNCSEFNNATGYTTSTSEKVLYYAVDNKVYTTSLGGVLDPVSYVGYTTPDPNDKITDIKMWLGYESYECNMQITDINNPGGEPLTVPNTKRMLVLTTHNESTGEGKIICVPITILNSPQNGLEKNPEYHRIFDGFGKILATSDMYKSLTN